MNCTRCDALLTGGLDTFGAPSEPLCWQCYAPLVDVHWDDDMIRDTEFYRVHCRVKVMLTGPVFGIESWQVIPIAYQLQLKASNE